MAQERIDEDPRLKTMWAGYAFSVDFRKKRGHAYMLEDQTYTQRVSEFKQPGTCIHCHASVYVPYKKAGNGDLIAGFETFNQMPYAEARKSFTHPDRVHRLPRSGDDGAPRDAARASSKGIRALKASQGVKDYDVNTMATRQEMRSYVCGQCHVEYYFKGDEKRLTYPWAKGLRVDEIADYYDEIGFKDWVHADTGTPQLKAQHPEFEMWNQGIHARSGVACADCHMPYTRVGALKISDHHVRSPLLNINNACQTCHKWPEEELLARAEKIQERTVDAAQPGHGRADGAHRGHQGREGGGSAGRGARSGAEGAAPRPVLPGLRRVGELERLPRAAGGRPDPRRGDRPLPAGTGVAEAARRPGPGRAGRASALRDETRPAARRSG